ncbi:MAG: hypothetical protein AAFZ35_17190 [Cyanobacteria bacterium J06649_12]
MQHIPIAKVISTTQLCIKALEYLKIIKKEESVQKLDKDLKAGINTMQHIAGANSDIALVRYVNDAYHSFNRAEVSIQNGLVKHEKEKLWTYLGLAYCHTAFGEINNAKESLRAILVILVDDNPVDRFRSDVIADSYFLPEQVVEEADQEIQLANPQEALMYGANISQHLAVATVQSLKRAIRREDSPTTKQYKRRVRELDDIKASIRKVLLTLESEG